MDRTVDLICCLFVAVGLAFSSLANDIARDTQAFVDRAVLVGGEVADLDWSRDTSTSSGSGIYHPVVAYITSAGERRTFRSLIGSSPPAYRVGETVDVLYDRTNPADARIASFWSLWFVQIVFGVVGSVLALVGFGFFVYRRIMAWRVRDLRGHGRPVETDFQNVVVPRVGDRRS
jgi:hypothetical protein